MGQTFRTYPDVFSHSLVQLFFSTEEARNRQFQKVWRKIKFAKNQHWSRVRERLWRVRKSHFSVKKGVLGRFRFVLSLFRISEIIEQNFRKFEQKQRRGNRWRTL